MDDHKKHMQQASRLAFEGMMKGEGGPFGAIVVKDGAIIGKAIYENRISIESLKAFNEKNANKC